MISNFFIRRPVFANVLAVLTVVMGFVSLARLPVERYPPITPPTVVVSTTYPGANARVVADTVAAPIEQQINGVENMLYMSSTSSANGNYSLTVTFEIGSNLEDAQVLVQNRMSIAEPQLPEEVRRQGVTVRKQSSNIVLAVALTSPNGKFDDLFLSNYANLRLRDALSRVPGVGDVNVRGVGNYAMRVWLNPESLASRQLTTQDVVAALARQNVQVAPGQIGQPPNSSGQAFQFSVTTLGRLSEPEQFGKIVVKSDDANRMVYLRDVARVELGAQTYDSFAARNGLESANILIYQLPGSNAIEVAHGVRREMERIKPTLPDDVEYSIPFDTTKFVEAAIHEVYLTLAIASLLVLAVILLFLQSWRAIMIPATTVPVTIIGAFIFMDLLGFSVNLLTMFGLILAIGIVVDDAIVIVENAAHHIERGLSPHDATVQAMREVTGPVISITFVLMAVFLPTAFLGGITGQLYRQFALTIAATALLSAMNALTLKPVQCATWLRPASKKRNLFGRAFDAVYNPIEAAYGWLAALAVRFWYLLLIAFVAIAVFAGWWYQQTPTGFLPTEDQGYVIISLQLPDSASLDRTRQVAMKASEVCRSLQERGAVDGFFFLGGFSLLDGTNSSNAATMFLTWTDWSQRRTPELSQESLVNELRQKLGNLREAVAIVLVPPPIQGLGVAGGFQMQIQDREGVGLDILQERTLAVVDEAKKLGQIGSAATTFRAGVPQIFLNINRDKTERMGVSLGDLFSALQANLGSIYINDFNKFDRTFQVRIQADARFRSDPTQLWRVQVRNRRGGRVPIATLLDLESRLGPQSMIRYNLYPTASITGAGAQGVSSGDALQTMEEVANRVLPPSMGFDWTGVAFQEKKVRGQDVLAVSLAVLLVYLVLAAQYESWLLPFAVILTTPIGLLGVVAAIWVRGMDNNVYTQIGVVLIIALASKNAILIVEFARELRNAGQSIAGAAVQASRMRFRPIVMTSLAFILGVAPLVWATGAGAASRQALGTAVFGGMISATILSVFFVPAFFVAFQSLIEWFTPHTQHAAGPIIAPVDAPSHLPSIPPAPATAVNSPQELPVISPAEGPVPPTSTNSGTPKDPQPLPE